MRSNLLSSLRLSQWALLLMTACGLPSALWAQSSGGSLDDVLLNLGPATEADVRIIAAGQANDPAGPKYPSVAVEQRTFTGLFTPASVTTQLAIFSDDGCDVSVDGTKIHSRLSQGQALPDLGQSFHLVTPSQPWEAGRSYLIRVEYSNTVYQGLTDIDGATLFVFNGGGSVLPLDFVVIAKNSPTYFTGQQPIGLLAVWTGGALELKLTFSSPLPNPIPAGLITWDVTTGIAPPANSVSHTFMRATTGLETITIKVAGETRKVYVDYPDVGTLSERYGLLTLDPFLFASSGFYGTAAQEYAQGLEAGGMDGFDANAIQHAYWNAVIASDSSWSTGDALLATTAHEYSNCFSDGGQAFDSTSDLHNNGIGAQMEYETSGGQIQVGRIQLELAEKLANGTLWRSMSIGSQVEKTNGTPIYAQ